jgi:hypothetical protein
VTSETERALLEERIARERAALGGALTDLRAMARAEFDVRRRVRARPSSWLGAAFFFGFLLGVRR